MTKGTFHLVKDFFSLQGQENFVREDDRPEQIQIKLHVTSDHIWDNDKGGKRGEIREGESECGSEKVDTGGQLNGKKSKGGKKERARAGGSRVVCGRMKDRRRKKKAWRDTFDVYWCQHEIVSAFEVVKQVQDVLFDFDDVFWSLVPTCGKCSMDTGEQFIEDNAVQEIIREASDLFERIEVGVCPPEVGLGRGTGRRKREGSG
eukprot:TRINITY_DN25436_c0_g1_i1.p1 TRINITY_DN25436_c0_g1~~TRINITY_DN25436_c0_g1_i1.p1  ORF type:complete len:204 (-),score=10.71 TRINITY_DN25436_c0_g1_i1:375-986(-)